MADRSSISIWSILKQCIGKVDILFKLTDKNFQILGIIKNNYANCLE
jgi:hypothetical protein